MSNPNWLDAIEEELDSQVLRQVVLSDVETVTEMRLLNALLDEDDEPHPC